MPGISPTGGNVQDYLLGRGILYFDGDQPAGFAVPGWRDMGNATEFTVSLESETKEHQSFLEGLKVIDKEVLISQKMTLSFTLDEMNFNNLAMFTLGAKKGANADGLAIINASVLASNDAGWVNANVWIVDLYLGTWYDLELVPSALPNERRRAYDFEAGQIRSGATKDVRFNPTGRTDLAGGTGLVERTASVPNGDYELDRKMGRIRFFSGGPGTVVGGGNALVFWQAAVLKTDPLDVELEAVAMLAQSGYQGRVRLITVNPASADHLMEWTFHSVNLRPNGDLSLITDEYASLSLTGVAQALQTAPYGLSRYGDLVTRRLFST